MRAKPQVKCLMYGLYDISYEDGIPSHHHRRVVQVAYADINMGYMIYHM
jgi:hypothetical protein